ncbi:Gfo/Idh/MocA family oxidoreductase [Streptomyces sp. ASQP_92]|uniref:Gfo/Idh/MocA family oxidoreductase n=1 Tax=Streptomyces sp. ASQP_92 TaxID=2979116 RepID=UPI0021C1F41A|nr:Gfo/Idh/MocA family oxidoreductase [Streptomyces sp. ASQP_92]MCT9088865.1 Gfo/Idh/MocA family oxidoreductase [Streptomyces sp. ASQP_92]
MTVPGRRPRLVVCGTKFGRIYLAGAARPDSPYEPAGVLARGSERSRRVAEHYGVPLYTDVDAVPKDVEACAVVVGSGINGGPGARIAQELMARGHHVLQEHPLHKEELADCLRAARAHRVVYRLNTHYPHVEPVRRFIATARRLLARQRALHIDAVCSFQVLYTTFDIIGRALGGVRPHALGSPAQLPPEAQQLTDGPPVYRSLDGVVGGVPLTLRLQNDMDPGDPDNHIHLFHRITLHTEGGHLTLANTHGPLLWSPRPYMPQDIRTTAGLAGSAAPHFALPSTEPLGPATAPDHRGILGELWPQAAARALGALRAAVAAREDPAGDGQYHLALCRLTAEATDRFGPVRLHRGSPPEVLSAASVDAGPSDPGSGP